jgi:hypothetical protein
MAKQGNPAPAGLAGSGLALLAHHAVHAVMSAVAASARRPLLAVGLVDHDDPAVVAGAQLLVRVQKLDPVDRAVRRQVDVQLVGDSARLDLPDCARRRT